MLFRSLAFSGFCWLDFGLLVLYHFDLWTFWSYVILTFLQLTLGHFNVPMSFRPSKCFSWAYRPSDFYAPGSNDRGHIVLSCLCVCLSVCLSVCLLSTLNLRYKLFETVRDRGLHIWHAYSTNDALSSDTKVNDLVTLTLTLKLKVAFFAPGSNDRAYCFLSCLSVCLFVGLFVCYQL